MVNPQQLEKGNTFDNISYIIQVTGEKRFGTSQIKIYIYIYIKSYKCHWNDQIHKYYSIKLYGKSLTIGKRNNMDVGTMLYRSSCPSLGRVNLLEYIQSMFLSSCNSITIFDLSTLYTTIPHSKLKDKLRELVQLCLIKKNGQRRYRYLVLGRDRSYLEKSL